MESLVIRGKIASGSSGKSSLPVDSHTGPITIAVAASSPQREDEPMLLTASIHEHLGRCAQPRGYHIHPPIIIKITERRAPSGYRNVAARIGPLKVPMFVDRKQWRLEVMQGRIKHLHVVDHMRLRNEDVLPAIVFEILQADPPSGRGSWLKA